MGLAWTWAAALDGVLGHPVRVEAHLAGGLPGTTLIGMGDAAVAQARERIRAAVLNSGCQWPDRRITLALSPAALPKKGSGFDLALAIAVLAAADEIPQPAAERYLLVGELGLDGSVRPVRGVLPLLLAGRDAGHGRAVVPADCLGEAALSGLEVLGVRNLSDLIDFLRGDGNQLLTPGSPAAATPARPPDLQDVLGQPEARVALEIAAAGGHHLAMVGPPGAGKTMLATRLPGLLPLLTEHEALEVTAVHSVAGSLDEDQPLVTAPPFVDPHHTASLAAVIGGGSGMPRPGSVSLAHRGVLFLDEAPEFRPTVLDGLRQPLESGTVLLSRAAGMVRYPARFQLVIAANPCPCAAARDVDCSCASGVRRRYLARMSGPLLDRVDIRIDIPALDPLAMTGGGPAPESTEKVAVRVRRAREVARRRWRDTPWRTNAEVPGPQLRRRLTIGHAETEVVQRAVRTGRLTGRGYDRVLRLALTCADLAGRAQPNRADMATALALRCGDE